MAQNGGEINRKSEKVRRANRIIQNRTMILMAVLGVLVFLILVIKLFSLQILRHDELEAKALDQQTRSTEVAATRGTIYDRNGNVLAYNELAYSVKIEDVFESGRKKNANLNETVMTLIRMIEKNGDHVITDFKIILNEDNEFEYSVEGTSRLRFIADVYGKRTIDKLDEKQKNATPEKQHKPPLQER